MDIDFKSAFSDFIDRREYEALRELSASLNFMGGDNRSPPISAPCRFIGFVVLNWIARIVRDKSNHIRDLALKDRAYVVERI